MEPKISHDIEQMSQVPYREAVGSFMYLMMGTRPDLSNFLREVSQFCSNPGSAHWKAVKRGLKYLRGTKSHGFVLGGRQNLDLLREKRYISA
jgi:hypothetical protein